MKGRRDLKPDAQACDKIIIETVPRFKESEMSGDEWRISARIQFWRKGVLIKEEYASNIEYAVRLLDHKFIQFAEGGGAYYAGENDICDQEGCDQLAQVIAKKKFDYCREGHKSESPSSAYRMFCKKHKNRGDCGLDDSNQNYEFVNYIGQQSEKNP